MERKDNLNKSIIQKMVWLLFKLDGRANLLHVWVFTLAYIGFLILLGISADKFGDSGVIIFLILGAPLLWAKIAVGVKRMHDLGKNGYYILLGVIPLVNLALLVYMYLIPGNIEPNEFGNKVEGF